MEWFLHAVLWLRAHSVVGMMAAFIIIVAVTYWPSRRKKIESYGKIPFRDDR
jgi:cbb3-type cytochrome oxidase subunit 3